MKPFLLLFFLFVALTCKADYVHNGQTKYYGKIFRVTRDSVFLKDGCNGIDRSFSWKQNVSIFFTKGCTPPGFEPNAATFDYNVKCPGRRLFLIKLNEEEEIYYASSVTISDKQITLNLYSKSGGGKINRIPLKGRNVFQVLDWITLKWTCSDKIPEKIKELSIS